MSLFECSNKTNVTVACDDYSARANSSAEFASSLLTWRVFVTVSSLLAAFIITGNALVIASYASNPRLRSGTYKFLVSLATSDILVGSVSLPMWIYLRSINDSPSGLLPVLFKCFDIFSAMASIFHLVVICVERHIAISQPFKYISGTFYRAMITAAWMLAIFFSLVTLVEFVKEFYAAVIFIVGFLLPMIVIIFVYGNISREARALIRRTPEWRDEVAARRKTTRLRDERRVTITLLLISILFVLCWLPFFLVSVIAKFSLPTLPSEEQNLRLLVTLVKWLHFTNSALNPVVYAFRDREMRATFRKLVKLTPQMCAKNSEIQEQNDRLELQPPNPPLGALGVGIQPLRSLSPA